MVPLKALKGFSSGKLILLEYKIFGHTRSLKTFLLFLDGQYAQEFSVKQAFYCSFSLPAHWFDENFITYACEACVCMCEDMHMHKSSIF